MNGAMRFLAVLLLTLTLFSCTQQKSDGESDVRDCFESVMDAFLTGNSSLLLGNIDNESFRYFSELRRHALRSSERRVHSLPLTNKLMVLTIRHNVPVEVLEEMKTRDMIVYLLDEGLIGGKRGESSPGIGPIRIEGNRAYAAVVDS